MKTSTTSRTIDVDRTQHSSTSFVSPSMNPELLARLAQRDAWGYRPGEPPAAEPTALCALALVGNDRIEAAIAALDELGRMQAPAGSVGLHESEAAPHWSTAYAVLAWQAAIRKLPPEQSARSRYLAAVEQGCTFLLSIEGERIDPSKAPEIGHNSWLVGWPWIKGTHSWLEPTALAYLALKAAGKRAHARSVEAAALLVDRLLPSGGANHGNTFVLGQLLKPHLQPTGLALLALGGQETEGNPLVEKSLQYVEQTADDTTAAASLAYALLGLTVHGRRPAKADALITAALAKPTIDMGASGPRRPLLALAALGDKSPLVEMARTGVPT